jgi:hypothetical protein
MGPKPMHAAPIWPCSRWGLPCRSRYRKRGALLPHPFTLTPDTFSGVTGGLLSVALSLESPPPDVIRHRISVEPGLSSPAPGPMTGPGSGAVIQPADVCHQRIADMNAVCIVLSYDKSDYTVARSESKACVAAMMHFQFILSFQAFRLMETGGVSVDQVSSGRRRSDIQCLCAPGTSPVATALNSSS